ncbi:MAG: outer membrane beta-barrel protein [Francisellaceae bacterium]
MHHRYSKLVLLITTILAGTQSGYSAKAENGFEIGGQLGLITAPQFETSNLASDSPTDQGGGLFGLIVGYDFAISSHLSLGVESGYSYGYKISEINIDGSHYSLNQWQTPMLATAKYYFNNGLIVSAKAGMSYIRQFVDTSSYYTPTDDDNWEILPQATFEIAYAFDNGVNVGGAFSYVFGNSHNIGSESAVSANQFDVASTAALYATITYHLPI